MIIFLDKKSRMDDKQIIVRVSSCSFSYVDPDYSMGEHLFFQSHSVAWKSKLFYYVIYKIAMDPENESVRNMNEINRKVTLMLNEFIKSNMIKVIYKIEPQFARNPDISCVHWLEILRESAQHLYKSGADFGPFYHDLVDKKHPLSIYPELEDIYAEKRAKLLEEIDNMDIHNIQIGWFILENARQTEHLLLEEHHECNRSHEELFLIGSGDIYPMIRESAKSIPGVPTILAPIVFVFGVLLLIIILAILYATGIDLTIPLFAGIVSIILITVVLAGIAQIKHNIPNPELDINHNYDACIIKLKPTMTPVQISYKGLRYVLYNEHFLAKLIRTRNALHRDL